MLANAGRALVRGVQQGSRPLRTPQQMQQRRGMSGGDDDGVHRVNWWDAPQNPDIWKKTQLAWGVIAIYTSIYWLVAGGSKKEAKPAA